MDLCPRCRGGEIHAPNCFKCGGSGWVNGSEAVQTKPLPPFSAKRPKAKKKKKRKQKAANTPDSATIAQSRARRIQEVREQREAEKARRVKTLKVRLSPEEQRKLQLEELKRKAEDQQKKEAQERMRLMEARRRASPRRDFIQVTRDGAIAGPPPKPHKHRKPVSPFIKQPDTTILAPSSLEAKPKKKRASKWATPDHSKERREKLEKRLGIHEEMEQRRLSREEQSASQVRNNQLQYQLAALVTSAKVPSEPLPAKKSEPAQRKSRKKHKSPLPSQPSRSTTRRRSVVSEPRFVSLESGRSGGKNRDFPNDDLSDFGGQRDDTEYVVEDWRQEDGGKYIGQSFRDSDGSFGSMPLYDDYDN